MEERKITRYWFEDQGQDLMFMDVDQMGVIQAAGISPELPNFTDIYKGQFHYDYFGGKKVKKNDPFRFSKGPEHEVRQIRWRIEKIETVTVNA